MSKDRDSRLAALAAAAPELAQVSPEDRAAIESLCSETDEDPDPRMVPLVVTKDGETVDLLDTIPAPAKLRSSWGAYMPPGPTRRSFRPKQDRPRLERLLGRWDQRLMEPPANKLPRLIYRVQGGIIFRPALETTLRLMLAMPGTIHPAKELAPVLGLSTKQTRRLIHLLLDLADNPPTQPVPLERWPMEGCADPEAPYDPSSVTYTDSLGRRFRGHWQRLHEGSGSRLVVDTWVDPCPDCGKPIERWRRGKRTCGKAACQKRVQRGRPVQV